tara:strand:+ start:1899 stop:2051 length:153 start_codon:yes stop_codon:yes gene_type:complete
MADKPTIYKTIPISNITSRTLTNLSSDESEKSENILNNFFRYFEKKHLDQ